MSGASGNAAETYPQPHHEPAQLSTKAGIAETPAAGTPIVEWTFRYQGDAIVAEYKDGTLYREYVTDDTGTIAKVIVPTGQTGTGTYLVTWNGHGDAMALHRIESSGSLTLANSYTYGTWGRPTTATHNSIADLGFRFLYVGAYDVQWDATYGLDLLYMHARHYSPSLGRFLQPDPSRLDEQLFVYAANGPVAASDPSGTRWYRLHRPSLRRAAYYQYVHGRISYRNYSRIYYAGAIRWWNKTYGQKVYFSSQDFCLGGVIAGTVGLITMGIIDTGLGVITAMAAPVPVANVVMVAVDAGPIAATFAMYKVVETTTRNNCDNIRWRMPWQ